jgi:uncharacterized protein (DUF1778 family)
MPYPEMMAVSKERPERLEARLTQRQKALLQRAAAIRGRSLTDFVVSAAEEAAERVIRSEFVISLGAEDSAAFAAALLSPASPNRALRAAAARYLRP